MYCRASYTHAQAFTAQHRSPALSVLVSGWITTNALFLRSESSNCSISTSAKSPMRSLTPDKYPEVRFCLVIGCFREECLAILTWLSLCLFEYANLSFQGHFLDLLSPSVVGRSDPSPRAALQLALLFTSIKLLLQFTLTLWTQHIGYNYFRDEFYYIACGRHLAWGFVDHGPIVALQARLGEFLFGDSLFAIRILSALAGAATVFLTGLLAWALGGLRPAQGLAMIGVLVAPIYIAVDGFLSMNSFEPVFWMLCALALIRLIDSAPQPFWWTVFGLSAGIGLLNKPSILIFLIAAGMGLLLTPQRRILFTRWAAVGIALIIGRDVALRCD